MFQMTLATIPNSRCVVTNVVFFIERIFVSGSRAASWAEASRFQEVYAVYLFLRIEKFVCIPTSATIVLTDVNIIVHRNR